MSTIQSISTSANSSYSNSSAAKTAQAADTTRTVQASGSGAGSSDATKALKIEDIPRKENTEVTADDAAKQNEALKRAVEEINKNASSSEAQFAVHEGTNRIMVKIVDKNTKEVIREFPPERTLDMIAKAWELAGLTIDERR